MSLTLSGRAVGTPQPTQYISALRLCLRVLSLVIGFPSSYYGPRRWPVSKTRNRIKFLQNFL